MATLMRISDGKGDSGGLSQAIRWNKDGTLQEVVGSTPIIGCSMLVGAVTARSYSCQDYWLTTEVTEIIDVVKGGEYDLYYKFKTGNSEYEWWTGTYPEEKKKKSVIGTTFEMINYDPLHNHLRVTNELFFINTISDGGYRDGYWKDEEDPTLDKLFKFNNEFTDKLLDLYESRMDIVNIEYPHKPYEKAFNTLLLDETNKLLVYLGYRKSEEWGDDEKQQKTLIKLLVEKHLDVILSSIDDHKKYNTKLR